MAKVSNPRDLVACPFQDNEISRLTRALAHEQRRLPVHKSRDKPPVISSRIVAEVSRSLLAAPQSGPRDNLELHVLGEHFANAVEVARIEAVDVSRETRTLGLRHERRRTVVGFARQLAQPGAA